MKKVLSIVLAMVLVLTVMCSFSFAAEAQEEESDELMGSAVLCPNCGSPNAKSSTTVTDLGLFAVDCEHYAFGYDSVERYEYYTKVTCSDCLVTTTLDSYVDVLVSCGGFGPSI